MKFLSPEVARYLFKSTIWSCVEFCCHVWASSASNYLEMLEKLQEWICRTVGPSHAASLECLANHQNVSSLSLFYRYHFVDVHLNWLSWFHFLILEGGLLVILVNILYDFSVTILRFYKDVYVNCFFPCTARLRNYLPIECFLLIYYYYCYLNGFKFRINRHL